MNSKPTRETETIRSDIEMTRRRMDDTMDALGDRLRGRHLLDEIVGFFRSSGDDGDQAASRVGEKMSEVGHKVSQAAGTAANAVVDTVKKNPVPILLIGAGAAWLAYSMTRGSRDETEDYESEAGTEYDPDTHFDRPLEYPGGTAGKMGEASDETASAMGDTADTLKEKASDAADTLKDKASQLADRAGETLHSLRDRASDITDRVQDRTRELYARTRDRVAQTANDHPLELGLGCLAVGLAIGLALPTPEPVHRVAGPTLDRLKNRTRDASREFLQKGKRVVRAAADAAKHEAQSQGLTFDQLRQGVRGAASPENTRAGTEPADPSAASPAM